MKNKVTNKTFGVMFLTALLVSVFLSCSIDSGSPDFDTIDDTYDVNINRVMLYAGESKNIAYCWSDGIDYDKASKSFYGTGYVVYLNGTGNPYLFDRLYIYKDSIMTCAKYGLHAWESDFIPIDLNVYSNGTVSFDSIEVKVHERDDNGDHAPNYMAKISCDNALLVE